ncbi:hypothetical protein RJ639_012517 [Escallonia herrerae]|uniref:Mitochondrial acidic protein MAM33 n=1 Tax=Escallonia herrerae TaxID=1293975 RepID=A0AA88VQD6_9ASTE|nr:hypothetical protein RJ639_012517 [Escallonia herrerae]
MWRTAVAGGGAALQSWRRVTSPRRFSSVSTAVNSIVLRSLKEHYLEKVSPPSPFTVVKGALESGGPVLKRMYGDEEISISVMRLANIIPGEGDEDDGGINQLFLHVDVAKPGQMNALHFLCGLYPDAWAIHSVSMRPKAESSGFIVDPNKYSGPIFQDIGEGMRDTLHGYIEARGINENLFPFLQAWLYVKDHRQLMHWFKSVGSFINRKQGSEA